MNLSDMAAFRAPENSEDARDPWAGGRVQEARTSSSRLSALSSLVFSASASSLTRI